jgi:hypothetical protein
VIGIVTYKCNKDVRYKKAYMSGTFAQHFSTKKRCPKMFVHHCSEMEAENTEKIDCEAFHYPSQPKRNTKTSR